MNPRLMALLSAAGLLCASSDAQQSAAAPKDFQEYRARAESGDAAAQYHLGNSYLQGEGVEKNPTEAVKWFRRAAEQNLAAAQLGLGACFARGEGVPRDRVEGLKWYRRAAEQGNAIAQFNLGICYYDGAVVKRDYEEAYVWFNLASASDRDAADLRDILGKILTRQQIADVQRRTEQLRAQIEERSPRGR